MAPLCARSGVRSQQSRTFPWESEGEGEGGVREGDDVWVASATEAERKK
jgi:hypothetical protein